MVARAYVMCDVIENIAPLGFLDKFVPYVVTKYDLLPLYRQIISLMPLNERLIKQTDTCIKTILML